MAIKSDVRCSYWFCCCSVAQLCPILCDLMDCSTPSSLSFTISQSLLKFMSIELMMLSNHLILCCPLLLLSIFLSFRVAQLQGLFQWVGSSNQVAKVLMLQCQHQSFQCNNQEWFPLGLIGLVSFLFMGPSRVFSRTTIQKHQFFGIQPSLWLCMTTGKTIT